VRAALAFVAFGTLAIAITLHGTGNEPAAEAWGNWTLVFMLAAAFVPQRLDDWSVKVFGVALRRLRGGP